MFAIHGAKAMQIYHLACNNTHVNSHLYNKLFKQEYCAYSNFARNWEALLIANLEITKLETIILMGNIEMVDPSSTVASFFNIFLIFAHIYITCTWN